jgi:uncharacterized LabA/DUF88 family protein
VDQRATFLQIDLHSLFSTSNRGQKIDFEKIWDHFRYRDSEFLTDAIIYTIKGPEIDSIRFEKKLKTIGYNLKSKKTTKISRKNKHYSLNNDIIITIDCLIRLDQFDKLILMTNNGNFADLCSYLKTQGKQIEIWSFRETYNTVLEKYADKMQFLNENFCLKRPSINVFGINWGLEKMMDTTSGKVPIV